MTNRRGKQFQNAPEAVNKSGPRQGRIVESLMPLARLMAHTVVPDSPPPPEAQIADDITMLLHASSDTTGTTLTYLLYMLACCPSWYALVRHEVVRAAAEEADAAADGQTHTGTFSGSRPKQQQRRRRHRKRQKGQQKPQQREAQQAERLPPYATLSALPLLNAVVWETLRLFPPTPGGLQRVVPRGGARVAGVSNWLPPHTTLSVQAYTAQRDASVFRQPHAWQPWRWIATTGAPSEPISSRTFVLTPTTLRSTPTSSSLPLSSASSGDNDSRSSAYHAGAESGDEWTVFESEAMRESMLVFSNCSRACWGKTVALMELKLVTAAIVQRFSSLGLADKQQTMEDMRTTEQVWLVPRGKRCELVFNK